MEAPKEMCSLKGSTSNRMKTPPMNSWIWLHLILPCALSWSSRQLSTETLFKTMPSQCNTYLFFFSWVPVYTDKDQRLAVMSIGFLLNSRDDAVVWRGPKKNGIWYLIQPLTPRSNLLFSLLSTIHSCNVSSENLVLDQLIIPKLIIFFVLITYLVDIELIL